MSYIFEQNIKDKATTALILCTYRRITNMPKFLQKIRVQTNKNFDLYISNNCENQDNKLIKYFNKYNSDLGINVFIKNYYNKYKQFSRFYLAKELAEQGYEKIIFIDDDQVISSNFIQDCYDQYDEKSIKSFYAHKFNDNYWEKTRLKPDEEGNYAGGGGLISTSKIFLDDRLLSCPEKYYILDDLWLSYYILEFTNYKIKLLDTEIQFIYDDKATFVGLEKDKVEFCNKYILKKEKING
jgi:hypothetical protein